MADPMSTGAARVLRKLWFDYLDSVEPLRPRLHAYCLRLTGSVWDAEDLVQDTLLRGFGAIGRADMCPGRDPRGPGGRWFDKPQAYLSQIATNLWIDQKRRGARETLVADVDAVTPARPDVLTQAAGAALFGQTAPQERAAVVLKDVFDFSLDEIAEILSTTRGAVKAALHRGRAKLTGEPKPMPARNKTASPELIDKFIAAFNALDVAAVTALLLESNTWEVQGVGGERGTKTVWLSVIFRPGVTAKRYVVDGEPIVAFTFGAAGKTYLGAVFRLEETEGKISRILNYCFCVDTQAFVAMALGLEPWSVGYHQTGETLARMIEGADLPWDQSLAQPS
jgi:RNA polymerase sigma factor (sigma-70 family)